MISHEDNNYTGQSKASDESRSSDTGAAPDNRKTSDNGAAPDNSGISDDGAAFGGPEAAPSPVPYKKDGDRDYDPFHEYNYGLAHGERFYDDRGHHIPPPWRVPNNFATLSFFISLASIVLCCCSIYIPIAGSIMAITLAICSRYFNNPEQRLHPLAISSIIISTVILILVIGSLLINYVLVPYLRETYPEFNDLYNQYYKMIYDRLEQIENPGE